jgi:Raf kinase inhibitor-like YbhB/YbcL family protein
MAVQVTSTAFENNQRIPKKYTGEGADVSPPLAWSDLPAGTLELALICNDPDAPVGDWVHWVIYKIPAEAKGLPEAVPPDPRLAVPAGALQGKNS